jgi:endonuclease/exonuclease/phosphatase family metal-dependent hydrolase
MRILKYLLWLVVGLAGLFIVFLAYATLDNYTPPPEEVVFAREQQNPLSDSVFTMVIWNLGYAGLDSSMDFFYDGGEKVRPGKEEANRNLKNIMQTLEIFKGYDFILLQEVDKKSKRSYRTNMVAQIATSFKNYHSSFGKNYDVAFVPLPPTEPMGKVVSGLQTLSKHLPAEVVRHSFPGNYAWPTSLFMLDRCFMVNRYPLINGKELVVINTHNSAYDDGSLRQQQMAYLKGFLLDEYAAGNYVVVGGDWNQSPAGLVPAFPNDVFDKDDLTYIEEGYPDTAWTWAYDAYIPTNRRVMIPYTRGETPTTVIDFFLLSPNIELVTVTGIDLQFAWSDHHPVIMNFKLNEQ